LKDGTTLYFPYNAGSTLPLLLTRQYFKHSANFVGLSYAHTQQLAGTNQMHTFMSVADEVNQNLTISQKELLLWHQRLSHADQQQIQQMLAEHVNSDLPQVIQPKNARASAVLHFLCAKCQLAKQPRTGADMSRSILVPGKRGGLTTDKLQAGQTVSIDQYMSSLAHTKGKESKSKKFTGGNLFVDHATLYIHCTNQVSLRVGETLKGKNAFEKYVKQSGVDITGFHADNAPFRAAKFVRDYDNKNQAIDYSVFGAHHQHGLAKGSIKTVCSWACAMMLHSIIHWPGEVRLDL
jgi:catabolite regulation protein CreA